MNYCNRKKMLWGAARGRISGTRIVEIPKVLLFITRRALPEEAARPVL